MSSRSPTRSLPEGTMIGAYRLLGLIGSGSMGEVYEAQHLPSKRRVALKVLKEKTEEANAGRRLMEEAHAAIDIRHPGIVTVCDVGLMGEGRPWLAMELLNGHPLSVFSRLRTPSLDDNLLILEGILDALSAAHQAGVIHRDLKPSNVFVLAGDRPRIKLLDFGVARREARKEVLTGPAMAVGSMGFMAPEQLMGQAVASSDLYAVGCIAFLLLAGRPVFPLRNIPENARSHFSEKPAKLRSLRPELSEGLEVWLDRMLGKKPELRFATAAEALSVLRSLAVGEPTNSGKKTEMVMAYVPTQPTEPNNGKTGEEPSRTEDGSTTLLDS